MILNISRAAQFQECRQKAKYWHQDGLSSLREADALIYGGAVHLGLAHFFANQDPKAAVAIVEAEYRARLQGQMILAEELPDIEKSIEQCKRAVAMFADQYREDEFKVLWPEVEFLVPIPSTEHHCWYFHRILHPDVAFEECQDSECVRPIYFTGRTDAVVSAMHKVWLLETKTTAMTGNIFYDRFYLDFQPTGYLYGIWKKMGTRPHGFFLNVIKKPNKRAADQFSLGFEREAYVRTDEDLLRFEREFVMLAQDYEDAFRRGRIYMNTKSCTNYNRQCYYWQVCKRGGVVYDGEFRKRSPDYVDLKYYEILGIKPPETEVKDPYEVDLLG